MLRDDMTPMSYRIRFLDNDVERTHYSDDRRHFEQLIAQHGHLSDLQIEPLTLTPEQQQRLDAIKDAGLSTHDAAVYVQHGTTESDDTAFFDAAKLLDYHRAQVEPQVKAQRKAAEALGVTLNGVHYDGSADNRQAIQEALTAAADAGMTTFASWKDSAGKHHAQHPVSDVETALRQIGQRRAALIELEGQHVDAVAAGTDPLTLDWSTEWD
jgi:hypothetical protein